MILRFNGSPAGIHAPYVGETCWSLDSVSYDPFAGVFINFSVGVPGGNVIVEVQGTRRQLRKQNKCVYELNYPKDIHSCDPDHPRVHVCAA